MPSAALPGAVGTRSLCALSLLAFPENFAEEQLNCTIQFQFTALAEAARRQTPDIHSSAVR